MIYSTLPASNATYTNDHYQCAQAALISSWRAVFGLPGASFFGVVQLSTFCLRSVDGNLRLARMRQQQVEGLSQPGDALVTNADYGWACDFHPPWKVHPGHRLANASLALVYAQALEWRSPTYRAASALNASALQVALSNLPPGSALELWPAAANSQYMTPPPPPAHAGYWRPLYLTTPTPSRDTSPTPPFPPRLWRSADGAECRSALYLRLGSAAV